MKEIKINSCGSCPYLKREAYIHEHYVMICTYDARSSCKFRQEKIVYPCKIYNELEKIIGVCRLLSRFGHVGGYNDWDDKQKEINVPFVYFNSRSDEFRTETKQLTTFKYYTNYQPDWCPLPEVNPEKINCFCGRHNVWHRTVDNDGECPACIWEKKWAEDMKPKPLEEKKEDELKEIVMQIVREAEYTAHISTQYPPMPHSYDALINKIREFFRQRAKEKIEKLPKHHILRSVGLGYDRSPDGITVDEALKSLEDL